MQNLIFVALGGMIGAVARYSAVMFVQQHVNAVFPRGSFLVNASCSLLIGTLVEFFSVVVIPRRRIVFIHRLHRIKYDIFCIQYGDGKFNVIVRSILRV